MKSAPARILPPDSSRIYVGDVVPVPRDFLKSQGKRRRIDSTGPLFLFVLLAAAFVPSVLSDIDISSFLKAIDTGLVAIVGESPFLSENGNDSRTAGGDCLCGPSGPQSADSAAIALDLLPSPPPPSSKDPPGGPGGPSDPHPAPAHLPRAPPTFS